MSASIKTPPIGGDAKSARDGFSPASNFTEPRRRFVCRACGATARRRSYYTARYSANGVGGICGGGPWTRLEDVLIQLVFPRIGGLRPECMITLQMSADGKKTYLAAYFGKFHIAACFWMEIVMLVCHVLLHCYLPSLGMPGDEGHRISTETSGGRAICATNI